MYRIDTGLYAKALSKIDPPQTLGHKGNLSCETGTARAKWAKG